MKKYTKMVLTGVLLSSTILGVSTSVVQAASIPEINVDTSSIANNVIKVINDLLNSSSTANKVSSQTKFSDLTDGETMLVAPIFGKKSSTEFNKVLQGELNVVDGNTQLVPMKVVDANTTTNGFVKEVSYTLDGTTKTVNVKYNYDLPTVSFNDNQVMNFSAADGDSVIERISQSKDLVNVNSTNGDDANGNPNKTSVTASAVSGSNNVTFTPSDSYSTEGISATRTVNVYTAPNVDSQIVNNTENLKQPIVVVNSSGQRFLVKFGTPQSDATGVDYTATAIDSKGNKINDNSTNKPISFSGSTGLEPDTASAYPIAVYEESGNVVYTKKLGPRSLDGGTIKSDEIKSALASTSYEVTSPSDFTYAPNNNTKTYEVDQKVSNTINYYDINTGIKVGNPDTLSGKDGDADTLNVPAGYTLVNQADLNQKLVADQPAKNVYVKKIAEGANDLSYTVTFRDKNNKQIGTEVKGTSSFGSYVSLTAPSGYAFASILDSGFIQLKNNQNVTKYVVAADTPYSISYVDQDTGKEVETQAGKGADGSKIVLKAPTGYAFVSADDVNYKIDKDTPTSTIYVQKSDQTEDNIVSGYPNDGYIKIYDKNGKLNKDAVLSEGSSWIIDKSLTINGSEYYRVATNEYVKASDVYKYTPLQTVATTNGKNLTPVYNTKGQLIIDRALDTNTPWYTDRSATIKGQKMYRVATDEWIKDADSTLK